MEAYKVATLDVMGYSYGDMYFLDYKKVESEFYERLGSVIQDREELAEPEDIDGNSPWKIEKVPHKENLIKRAYYLIWEETCGYEGCESSIIGEEIVFEKIHIN
ncbi:hypothetical protein [Bacillus fungorum]|uniref:Uncharacterized protein n=1 Tax=Bacillus fungorum TaxID=2039284 RepID=A0A2G6QBC6_9BACI|nr:hypothetical protein [Bacillus fungorum]PIE94065.1 hypothetical protein CO726_17880 [Bacillus fungorum]